MPNRLSEETSPYLLQHANNPVDWYPWGKEAFALAKAQDRPILLSVGYAACHWCHVMEHESFEDETTAQLMNKLFVSIKVDREERPDVDQVYQQAVQMLGQQGGWPLTVFLTPDREPFFGGTYFPPIARWGRPSFSRVLSSMSGAYHNQRDAVLGQAKELVRGFEIVRKQMGPSQESTAVLEDIVPRAATKLLTRWDRRYGGFGDAPKFPSPKCIELLLRAYRRSDEAEFLEAAELQLTHMAEGGIYDHLRGGFHRYSVDAKWLVPHFEKMLYDNAQLLRLYSEAWQLTGKDLYSKCVGETVAYLLAEMRTPEGAFVSTQDADSEGVEGKYFVWTPNELRGVLGPEAAELVARCYDVTESGNFEGKNILHVVERPGNDAQKMALEAACAKLLVARRDRIPPGTDDKVLTSWNGLLIGSLAEAGRIFGERPWIEAAQTAADFVLDKLTRNGRLLRTYKDGAAKIEAFLDDHAFLADALILLAEAALEPRYFGEAKRLTDEVLERFYDDEDGPTFFLSGSGCEKLVSRPVSIADQAIPSGMSVVLQNLVRLGHLLGETRYLEVADEIVHAYHEHTLRAPLGFGNLLCAIDLWQDTPAQVIVRGEAAQGRALLAGIRSEYFPNRTLIFAPHGTQPPLGLAKILPPQSSDTLAYLCRKQTCSAPVGDAESLLRAIRG